MMDKHLPPPARADLAFARVMGFACSLLGVSIVFQPDSERHTLWSYTLTVVALVGMFWSGKLFWKHIDALSSKRAD